MRPFENQVVAPCPHMEGFLNRYADGSGGRLAKWYAKAHAMRCRPCGAFLTALIANRQRLRDLRDQGIDKAALERLREQSRHLAEKMDSIPPFS